MHDCVLIHQARLPVALVNGQASLDCIRWNQRHIRKLVQRKWIELRIRREEQSRIAELERDRVSKQREAEREAIELEAEQARLSLETKQYLAARQQQRQQAAAQRQAELWEEI